jgi:hypothetical protein
MELTKGLLAFCNAQAADFRTRSGKEYLYWLWPNISERQDVFDMRCTADWAVKMRDCIPHFHADLNLTNDVLTEMNEANMNFPECELNKRLNPRGLTVDSKVACAVNFVNMLAWRLWSDRTVGLKNVYFATTGIWPLRVDQYVHHPLEYNAGLPIGALLTGVRVNPSYGHSGGPGDDYASTRSTKTENVEVVIVRPNIEHYMLGVILGQGGESLGSTFWGQTELSCYDDSMHGIWGM